MWPYNSMHSLNSKASLPKLMVTVISEKKDWQKHEKNQIGWRVEKIDGIEFKNEWHYGLKLEDKQ